ncbi:hypothetical protein OIU85_011601 [Salix viminalis]|uniref:Uncharacterized protein n=1 Tax=Salix viminalis TaxID=40686 RepID=A0A9Q0NT46_SALVM|nr:hypothetical protein OIU85_011601 [Salix viminalis]
MIAKVRSRETCDPLCIIIYACCDESPELVSESQWGSRAAYCNCILREEWMKLLIFTIRLDEIHFPQLFSKLYHVSNSENGEEVDSSGSPVSFDRKRISFEFVAKHFERSIDLVSRGETGPPTGSICHG